MGAMSAGVTEVAALMAGFTMRSAMAAIFAIATVEGLRDRARYAQIVQAYRIVPDAFGQAFALVLPPLEGAIAICLLLPPTRGFASFAALAVLGCFTVAIVVNLARGRRDIACGCGGGHGQTISRGLVARNLLLICGLACSLAAPVHPRLDPAAYVGIAGLASFLVLLYLAANQLMVNGQALRT